MTAAPSVVLVHGAWGSPEMWEPVIAQLPPDLDVLVADLPTCQAAGTSLADDAAHVRALVGDRRAVIVGHSYGGAVITEAGGSIPGATHLLYLAAAMPAEGESMFEWVTKRPTDVEIPLDFHDDGTCELVIDWDESPYDETTTELLRAVRMRPFAIAGIMTKLTDAAWSTVPSTYVVATRDTTIHPDTQREMATRAGAVVEIDADHQVNLSHPEAIADLIRGLAAS